MSRAFNVEIKWKALRTISEVCFEQLIFFQPLKMYIALVTFTSIVRHVP